MFPQRFNERAPFERRVNELTEVRSFHPDSFDSMPTILAHTRVLAWFVKGFLLHAKTTGPEKTSRWNERCPRKGAGTTKSSSCQVGIPSREIILGEDNVTVVEDGYATSAAFESNCYRHSRVMREYVPRLELALRALNNRV
jgi:hypothetical protein